MSALGAEGGMDGTAVVLATGEVGSMINQEARNDDVVAVVDDDAGTRHTISTWLTESGFNVRTFGDGRALADSGVSPAVVFLDVDLGPGTESGLEVLRRLTTASPDLAVIMVTSENQPETVVEAMRAGAYDYLVKPLNRERIKTTLTRAMERRGLAKDIARLESELSERPAPFRHVVGTSPAMEELRRQVERVLESDVAVALFGESGTGKELVARAIHSHGRRRAGPFVALNCAAIPEALQESELFGHERGAFTGAVGVHQGRFEQANGGTLFLDEVGEMSPMTQATLLRTLQERTVRRVGGVHEIPVDVRVICATHRDLEREVRAGRFREDLYFRLVVYPIQVPALRERKADVPLLVAHFLRKYKDDVGRTVTSAGHDFIEALTTHDWPGNVRELENVVHRAMLASDGGELGSQHLPPDLRARAAGGPLLESAARPPEPEEIVPMRELERRAIAQALRATGGSVEKAARLLGIGRATLYRRLAAYDSERR
ncbi:MAG: sigma-54-dependent Fis family transcriptional regulator [Myxococcales bacterium]|nr:sigma-54-dependent Fis family transcriptional regulator [Myxococcales bacterium]